MASGGEQKENKRKKSFFATVSDEQKQIVMKKRKKENTNKATKLWTNLLKDYLEDSGLPKVDDIPDADLPNIIENFYVAIRSKQKVEKEQKECDSKKENEEESQNTVDGDEEDPSKENCMYGSSTMRAIRSALNRYFRETRGIDITSDKPFIHCNEMFQGLLKINKEQGRGTVNHKQPICEEDMKKNFDYFKESMVSPPNAKSLQEILLFYIIYFTGRRGQENLRSMTKDHFQIAVDSDGKEYIYQAIDELNKNHSEDDTGPTTQARMYCIPGESILTKNNN